MFIVYLIATVVVLIASWTMGGIVGDEAVKRNPDKRKIVGVSLGYGALVIIWLIVTVLV